MQDQNNAGARQYRAIVYRELPASPDFARSERVVLPGRHTETSAWQVARAALASDAGLIGGAVEPCP